MSESTPVSEPPPSAPSHDAVTSTTSSTSGVRRNPLLFGAVVVVVAAVVVAVVLASSSTTKTTHRSVATPQALLTEATADTLANNTISLTLSLQATSGATSFALSGSGGCNVFERACSFTESVSGTSRTIALINPLSEVVADHVLYVKVPALLSGRETKYWSIPLHSSSSSSPASSSEFKVMAKLPALLGALKSDVKVTDLGSGTVAGVAVTNYAVAVNTQQIAASLRSALPGDESSAVPTKNPGSVSLQFAIDAQHRLRQLDVTLSTGVGGKTTTVHLDVTVTSYDAALSISAPPANEVEPLPSLGGL
jgi:hypothetical protein